MAIGYQNLIQCFIKNKGYIIAILFLLISFPISYLIIEGPVLNQQADKKNVKILYLNPPVEHAWVSVYEYEGVWNKIPQFGKHMGQTRFTNVEVDTMAHQKDSNFFFTIPLRKALEKNKLYAVTIHTNRLGNDQHVNETLLGVYDTFTTW